jgi:hypothetical protein
LESRKWNHGLPYIQTYIMQMNSYFFLLQLYPYILLSLFLKHDKKSHLFLANAAWGVIWSIFNIVAYLLVVLTLLRVSIISSRPYPSQGAYFSSRFHSSVEQALQSFKSYRFLPLWASAELV